MKILVMTSTFSRWVGDTEPRFVDDLCQRLSEHHQVDVLAPHAPMAAQTEQMGKVSVFRFRYCFDRWEQLAYDGGILPNLKANRLRLLLVPLFILAQLRALIKLLRENHYDAIHAHWIIPQGLTAILASKFLRSPPPVVLTSHGGDLFSLKGSVLAQLKRWICRGATHLIVVSSAMKAKAAETGLKPDEEISVVPMGTDSTRFTPRPVSTSRSGLLFVGRLVDKKGVEYLIDAMPRVLAQFPHEQLTVIGDGTLRHSLEARTRERGVAERVTFLGALPNHEIPRHLQRAAVLVFPSIVTESGDQEGTPVAIMEALACGCACVVSDYPGVRDIILENHTGLLAPQRSAEALATQIISLLRNPEQARELGEAGRKHVTANYDWRVIESRFSTIFHTLSVYSSPPAAQTPPHQ